MPFQTMEGRPIPAVTEDQMREVDRIAEENFGLSVLQMMENAGRSLALHALQMVAKRVAKVVVLAGSGGNGGGGICCARHLANRGVNAQLALAKEEQELMGSAAHQWNILKASGYAALPDEPELGDADLIVDALLGYSLKGAPRGRARELIEVCNRAEGRVLSLDMPSGMMATSGDLPGASIEAERVLTLALPKTGLSAYTGDLFLADIGIPPQVYHRLGIHFEPFFGDAYWIQLRHVAELS